MLAVLSVTYVTFRLKWAVCGWLLQRSRLRTIQLYPDSVKWGNSRWFPAAAHTIWVSYIVYSHLGDIPTGQQSTGQQPTGRHFSVIWASQLWLLRGRCLKCDIPTVFSKYLWVYEYIILYINLIVAGTTGVYLIMPVFFKLFFAAILIAHGIHGHTRNLSSKKGVLGEGQRASVLHGSYFLVPLPRLSVPFPQPLLMVAPVPIPSRKCQSHSSPGPANEVKVSKTTIHHVFTPEMHYSLNRNND